MSECSKKELKKDVLYGIVGAKRIMCTVDEEKLHTYLKEESILAFDSNRDCAEWFRIYDPDYDGELEAYQGPYGFSVDGKRYHILVDEALDVYESAGFLALQETYTFYVLNRFKEKVLFGQNFELSWYNQYGNTIYCYVLLQKHKDYTILYAKRVVNRNDYARPYSAAYIIGVERDGVFYLSSNDCFVELFSTSDESVVLPDNMMFFSDYCDKRVGELSDLVMSKVSFQDVEWSEEEQKELRNRVHSFLLVGDEGAYSNYRHWYSKNDIFGELCGVRDLTLEVLSELDAYSGSFARSCLMRAEVLRLSKITPLKAWEEALKCQVLEKGFSDKAYLTVTCTYGEGTVKGRICAADLKWALVYEQELCSMSVKVPQEHCRRIYPEDIVLITYRGKVLYKKEDILS